MNFALVVPNLNYANYLCHCLQSIENQEGVDVRVAIVDGGSTDGSVEIIKKFCDRNKWVYSRQDGLGQASSIVYGFEQLDLYPDTIMGWINSDDVFLSRHSLKEVENFFVNMFDVSVVSLGGYFIDNRGIYLKPVVYDYNPMIKGDLFLRGGGFLQPSTFWHKQVYEDVSINTNYRYVFDGDFFWRIKNKSYNFYVNQKVHISGYRIHGSNLSLNFPSDRILELSKLYKLEIKRSLSSNYLYLVYLFFKFLDRHIKYSSRIKMCFYLINNSISYLTRYRVPSI